MSEIQDPAVQEHQESKAKPEEKLNFEQLAAQLPDRRTPEQKEADRKEVRNIRIASGAIIIAIIGGSYAGIKHINTPEYIAQRAAEKAQKDADLAKSTELALDVFRNAREMGNGLFVVDLNKLDAAQELAMKYQDSETHERFKTRIISEHFHGFKDAHPDVEIIGIVDPTDIRPMGYSQFVEKPNQLIIITAPKPKAPVTINSQ